MRKAFLQSIVRETKILYSIKLIVWHCFFYNNSKNVKAETITMVTRCVTMKKEQHMLYNREIYTLYVNIYYVTQIQRLYRTTTDLISLSIVIFHSIMRFVTIHFVHKNGRKMVKM